MNRIILMLLVVFMGIGCNSNKQPIIHPDNGDNEQSVVFVPEPVPTGKFADIMTRLKNPKDNKVQICAHRGVSQVVPENSIAGINECIDLGIDVIEIDIAKTKDGKLILMHDNTLDRTTTGTGNVSDYSLADIKKLYLKDYNGNVTDKRVPTFEEALDAAKGKILVQVDKWNGLTDLALPIIKDKQCLQQAIFRSTLPYENIKATFKEYLDKIIYIPVIPAGRQDAQSILDGYLKNMPNMPVVCIVFPEENNPMLNQVPALKEKYRIWFNAISDNDSGKHGDKQAMEGDLENSYGWLVQKGANIIYTDQAILLDTFLKEKDWR